MNGDRIHAPRLINFHRHYRCVFIPDRIFFFENPQDSWVKTLLIDHYRCWGSGGWSWWFVLCCTSSVSARLALLPHKSGTSKGHVILVVYVILF
jgi:hypothetical protein